jgi:hypothetical protein
MEDPVKQGMWPKGLLGFDKGGVRAARLKDITGLMPTMTAGACQRVFEAHVRDSKDGTGGPGEDIVGGGHRRPRYNRSSVGNNWLEGDMLILC